MLTRLTNVVLGLAVAASAFAWPPSDVGFWHYLVLGLLVVVVALASIWWQSVRWLNVALGVWLFFSGWVFSRMGNFYVSMGAGTLILLLALVPTAARPRITVPTRRS